MSATSNYIEHDFADADTLAQALAQQIAEDLRAGLAARDNATLALSGGTTPKAFLQRLSQQVLDWSRVTVTMVDERWVDQHDPRSNARLIADNLLQHAAAQAQFVPLFAATPDPESGLALVAARVAALKLPFDAVVLGLGEDGHTASFFPGGDRLAQALDPDGQAQVSSMRAPDAGEPRITLTLPTLLSSHALYLHIQGAGKRAVFTQVTAGSGALQHSPMRHVIDQAPRPIEVFWCP